jgi:hypothetical protein
MRDIESMIRQVVREAVYDRPYGVAYTGAMVEEEVFIRKLHDATIIEANKYGLNMDGWSIPSDYHMTICLGELPLHMKMRGDLNKDVELHITHFGFNDKAAAFQVTGYMSKNDMQHITVAFKEKPADSKDITQWYELERPFTLTAMIREAAKAKP